MIDRVTEDALSLPTENRLILVEKLLRSLNLPINEDIDRLWAEEAELRISQKRREGQTYTFHKKIFFSILFKSLPIKRRSA